ncbi:hypothetical protein V6N13_101420 [Hibiscus sabdariffa]
MDGAHELVNGYSKCGGVLRDHSGIQCGWDMGAQWVVIETDSMEVVSLLQQRSTSRANLTILAHVLNCCNLVGTFEFNISLAQAILLQTDWPSWLR